MAKMTFSGFDEFEKEINKYVEKVEKVSRKKHVAYSRLFSSDFLKKHTKFTSFKKMMEASGFDCSTQEKFDNIPKEDLDKFIQSISRYHSFENMLEAASEEYFKKELEV